MCYLQAVGGGMIKVEKEENPSKERVAELLQVLEDKIVELFEAHKSIYGKMLH